MSERPMPKRKSKKINPGVWVAIGCGIAAVLIVAVAVAVNIGSRLNDQSGMPSSEVRQANPTAKLSAPDLWREFGSNSIAAEKKYFGQVVELKGSVDEISSDGKGYFVAFTMMYNWPQVVCYLADGERDRAAKLKKGAMIRIKTIPRKFAQNDELRLGHTVTCDSTVIMD